MLFEFIGATQAKAWDRLVGLHGGADQAQMKFAKRLAAEIDARGTVDVLRRGVEDMGVKLRLAFFKPAHALTPDLFALYDANRLVVSRQVHHSESNPQDSLDLLLLVNGLPVATVELKNQVTGQTVEHAKRQYRFDRNPKDLVFDRRTVVHFAVDQDLVFLTTRLEGERTRFLPFNQGSGGPGREGGKGNPPNPHGYRTSYLWEQVWQQEVLHPGPFGVFPYVLDHGAPSHRAARSRPGLCKPDPVPIWRNPALEALLGGPLDATGLTDAAVRSLVAQQAREDEALELKSKPYPGAPAGAPVPWTAEQELAKDITALANTAGGLLLIGVEETAGVATAATPFPDDPETVVQRLVRALVNHSAPVPRVAWVTIPADAGGHYLAAIVPPSPLAPHAVTGQRGDSRRPLHWFARDVADCRPLAEPEIADRYRTRFRGADDQRARRERVAVEGRDYLGGTDALWLWTASVPHTPVPARLDAQAVQDATTWWQTEYRFGSPLGRGLEANGRPVAGPWRTIFTGYARYDDENPAAPRGAYLELHTDGSAFAATPVGLNTGLNGGIGDTTLSDDLSLLVDACLSWTIRQAGAWGNADLLAGLRDGQAPDGQLAQPAELVYATHGEARRHQGTRSLDRPPAVTIAVDLTASNTLPGRLAVTGSAAAAIVQWFGLPEAPQISPDGTLRPWQWGNDRARQVEQWANNHKVPHER